MQYRKKLSAEEALIKIRHYCSYQERCHVEVQQKLYGFGLFKKDVDYIISNLIENNYLNEERFAIQFAGGKFRINHWGKRKIEYELQQKRVSSYCIKKALKDISEEDYLTTVSKLAETKWKVLKGEHHLTRQAKTHKYLMQKGFEPIVISKALHQIIESNKN
jgi:regulatory protein